VASSAALRAEEALTATSTTSLSRLLDTFTSELTSSPEMSQPSRRSSWAVASATRRESTTATLLAERLSASSEAGRRPRALISAPIVWRKSSFDVDE
jgi:hypothetical protein